MTNEDGSAEVSRRLRRLHRQSRARGPASARSPAGAARTATRPAAATPNPRAARALHRQRLLLRCTSCRRAQRYYKHANRDYLEWRGRAWASSATPTPIVLPALQRADAEDSALPREGHGADAAAASRTATASTTYFDPLPFWYPPFEEAADRRRRLSAARDHAAADGHVSLAGARRTPGCGRSTAQNRLYMHRARAAQLGIEDDDWVWIDQPHRPRQGAR